MMDWRHEVSTDWLRARQGWLTASEIADILPVTSTGRKRQQSTINNNVLKIWANKQQVTVDPVSTGAAARGHILEPYAILERNAMFAYGDKQALQHWDDVLIYDADKGIAFSPDALDIPQPKHAVAINAKDAALTDMTMLGEVKSYSPDHHCTAILAGKERLPERFQIATAMAVSPQIQEAELILYNPNLRQGALCVKTYNRAMLEEEIGMVEEAANKYWEQAVCYASKIGNSVAIYSEEHIKAQWEDDEYGIS